MEYVEGSVDVHDEVTAKKLLDALAEMLGDQRFDLWLGPETRLRFEETKVVFAVKNDFAIQWIRSNFMTEIGRVCRDLFGEERTVEITVLKQGDQGFVRPCTMNAATSSAKVVESVASPVLQTAGIVTGPHSTGPHSTGPADPVKATGARPLVSHPHSPIRSVDAPKSTPRRFRCLETFVEGDSNRLACRAADLAVNHSGRLNPIYIHGPNSVGKTHLLEGIYTAVHRARDRKPPRYLTAEQFISAFMESIRPGASRDGIQRFRSRFRGISILLLDDIQYLVRAAATQGELQHVIDTLCGDGVQMVLTGDRPLNELHGLRNEIRCRLGAGMPCAIELPEREMSLQIFRNMVAHRTLPVGMDVCRMVASRLGTDARQLQGALNRLHAVHLGTGKPITLELAEESLADLVRQSRRDVRLVDIEKAVCEEFGISEDALKSKSRAKCVSTPRMLAMWLARKYTRSALSEIGRYFGDRSHSSVVSAQKKVDRWIDADHPIHGGDAEMPIAESIRRIERKLNVVASG